MRERACKCKHLKNDLCAVYLKPDLPDHYKYLGKFFKIQISSLNVLYFEKAPPVILMISH